MYMPASTPVMGVHSGGMAPDQPMDLQQVSEAMSVWAAYLTRLTSQQRPMAALGQVRMC